MLTSLAAGVLLNNTPPPSENTEVTLTSTPADNFPDAQRAQFCGSGDAKSTTFVKEYTIPTACTNPLAIVTDYNGNKITFLDPTQSDDNLRYLSLPSPVNDSVTGDFAIDTDKNVWYTNWIFQQGGILIKFDQEGYRNSIANVDGNSLPVLDYIEIFQLPFELLTPNGIAVSDCMIWLADTSSSAVFNFDPVTQQFTQYVTSNPKISTYGNSTGIIKSPISRPYWIETNSAGQLVFNEQTANSIAILDPKSESLVEYMIPSKNPFWGDCAPDSDCGLAQIFDFAIHNDKIWFTEWVENNIGVVDTSIALPFGVELGSKDISLVSGESKNQILS